MKLLPAAISLATIAATPVLAQSIEITPHAERPAAAAPPAAFTGTAIVDILFRPNDESQTMASHVMFAPGARTSWHDHPAGQYLIVTSGVGWVQERGGEKREMRAGDVVWIAPGVAHWHGASATVAMSHIAVFDFVDGNGGVPMEPVSDEDYLSELATK